MCAVQQQPSSVRTCNQTSFAGNRLGAVLLIATLKLPLRMRISHGSAAGALVGSIGTQVAKDVGQEEND